MILGGRQQLEGAAIDQRHHRGFLAYQAFLDHHPGPRAPEDPCLHDVGDRLVSLLQRVGHDHALARRQPVRLDHDRRAHFSEVGARRVRLVENPCPGRGHAVLEQDLFAEHLAAFELRRTRGRAENLQAA